VHYVALSRVDGEAVASKEKKKHGKKGKAKQMDAELES
jgi:hypothetical protein